MILPEFLVSLRDLCLFRRGPEDMPYAPALLAALIAASVAMQIVFNYRDGAVAAVIAGSVIGGFAALGTVFMMLRGRGKPERFLQTATALVAVYLLFGIVNNLLSLTLPLKAWSAQLRAEPPHFPDVTGSQTLVLMVASALGIWRLCVWIGSLRRSLEVTTIGGVFAFIMLVLVNFIVTTIVAGLIGVA